MKLEPIERLVVVGGGASPYRATGLPVGPTPQPLGKILKTELPEPYCGLGRRVH